MVVIFAGSILVLVVEMINPRYFTSCQWNSHFSGLRCSPAFVSASKTFSTCLW
jgi:hypothetical protein